MCLHENGTYLLQNPVQAPPFSTHLVFYLFPYNLHRFCHTDKEIFALQWKVLLPLENLTLTSTTFFTFQYAINTSKSFHKSSYQKKNIQHFLFFFLFSFVIVHLRHRSCGKCLMFAIRLLFPGEKYQNFLILFACIFAGNIRRIIHHAKMRSIPTKQDYFYSQANMHGNKLFASVGTRLNSPWRRNEKNVFFPRINFRELNIEIFCENEVSRMQENQIFRGNKLSRIHRKIAKFLPFTASAHKLLSSRRSLVCPPCQKTSYFIYSELDLQDQRRFIELGGCARSYFFQKGGTNWAPLWAIVSCVKQPYLVPIPTFVITRQ